MNSPEIITAMKLARKIKQDCDQFPLNPAFSLLQNSLNQAISFAELQNSGRPLVISLIGGTGVGKSYIFSRLLERDSASPSSDSVRGFTRKIHVSAQDSDRPFLNFGDDTVFLPGVLEGAVLIDTPDLDSIQQENLELTRKIIQESDLLVYITSPDKRSNFDINETIREWASRKRWFFVMNKADTAADTATDRLISDFTQKIEALGFKINPESLFVFSAREENSFAFNKFKDNIFSKRCLSLNQKVREAAILRNLLHATSENPAFSQIEAINKALSAAVLQIEEKLQKVPAAVLAERRLDELADMARTTVVYRQLQQKKSFFMFPYIWVNVHANREVSGAEIAARIATSLKTNACLKDAGNDEIRVLEDHRLLDGQSLVSQDNEDLQLLQKINDNLTVSAHQVSSNRLLTFYLFLANLLPGFILLQALYRSFSHWLTGTWLPSDFFIHAALLTCGATIPGYLLLSRGVARISNKHALTDLDLQMNARQINDCSQKIHIILNDSEKLRDFCTRALQQLETQLEDYSAGITRAS